MLLLVVLYLVGNVLSSEIEICVNRSGIYCFAYLTSIVSYDDDGFTLSHNNMSEILNSYDEDNVVDYNFVDNKCKVLKISGFGRFSLKVWPYVSTSHATNLSQLDIPAAFDKVEYLFDITESDFKEGIILDPILGTNSISGSILLTYGHIDSRSLLVGIMNENGHTYTIDVKDDFTYRFNNLPNGTYRIFPIRLNNIIHMPKEAKIFCSNYYINKPHHSCVYSNVYNSGVDRLSLPSKVMRSVDEYLNSLIELSESMDGVDLSMIGNGSDSTISLLIKSTRKTLYTVELHEIISGKNMNKKEQIISRMESIDFYDIKQGNYLIQIWLAPLGVDVIDSNNTRGGFMTEITLTIQPYDGIVYIGVDFDMLFKGKTYLDDDDLIFNSIVQFFMRIFGKIPVHIICWSLIIYGLCLYYGYSRSNFMDLFNGLLKSKIKRKSI